MEIQSYSSIFCVKLYGWTQTVLVFFVWNIGADWNSAITENTEMVSKICEHQTYFWFSNAKQFYTMHVFRVWQKSWYPSFFCSVVLLCSFVVLFIFSRWKFFTGSHMNRPGWRSHWSSVLLIFIVVFNMFFGLCFRSHRSPWKTLQPVTPTAKAVFFHQTKQSLAFAQKQEVKMDPKIILLKTIRKRPTNHGRTQSYSILVFQHSSALNYNPNSSHVVFMLTHRVNLKDMIVAEMTSVFIPLQCISIIASMLLIAKTTYSFGHWSKLSRLSSFKNNVIYLNCFLDENALKFENIFPQH